LALEIHLERVHLQPKTAQGPRISPEALG